MKHSSGSMGFKNMARNMESGGLAYGISEGNKDCVESVRGHSGYLTAKDLVTVCSCPESLSEAEFKTKGQVRWFSRQRDLPLT